MAKTTTTEAYVQSCLQLLKVRQQSLVYKLLTYKTIWRNPANIACGNQVLMQTATTTVGRNPENQSISVRIILDSGSQRTYITEKLAENLKLELKPPERLSVATFGSDKPKQIKYRDTVLQLT